MKIPDRSLQFQLQTPVQSIEIQDQSPGSQIPTLVIDQRRLADESAVLVVQGAIYIGGFSHEDWAIGL